MSYALSLAFCITTNLTLGTTLGGQGNVNKKVIRDLLSQIDNIDEIISGCTDSKSSNYDSAALKNDGSCVYSNVLWGIDFLLNNYKPESQEIDVLFKTMINSDKNEIAGFQFAVTGANVTHVSGGDAEEAGFSLSSSSYMVLGFSLEGATISVNGTTDVLVTLTLIDMSDEICLADIILANTEGNTIISNGAYCLSIK